MTTLSAIFHAFAPESLARSPTLPTSHPKVISALQHCRSGPDGHRLSPCHSGGQHHRVHHACGHRHCPQGPHHTTPPWFQHHLATQLPGPHFLVTFTVPETLRPCLRSPQRLASHAMFTASSHALTRLAHAERCLGTTLPSFPGLLHPWGRPLQDHPHLHSMVPGGGLSEDRTTGRPSRAHCSVPVKALAPIDHALFKEDMGHAGLLEQIDPLVWHTTWNVHRQANPDGHASFPYLAPYVFKVALSNRRLVSRTDRPVTVTSRTRGRTRPRTTPLDAREFLRRCLPQVLPDGFRKVRHCGLLPASCAVPPDTIRLMISKAHPIGGQPTRLVPPAPSVACCPTCGGPLRVVMRLWTSNSAVLDTG